eukprot:8967528-Pyramimonas_sp.AAC.1
MHLLEGYLAEELRPSARASLGWMGPPRAGSHQTVTSAILSTVGPVTEIYSSLLSLPPSKGRMQPCT